MTRTLLAAGFAIAAVTASHAATLDTVKQRGQLVCGGSTGFAGFSTPHSQGKFPGLAADYCRAMGAPIFGDPAKVRFVALTAQNRFTALQSGEIDVLLRNSTQTLVFAVSIGIPIGPVNFYDGQGFVVKRDTGVDKVEGLNGATVCVAQGTTHEVTLGDYARAHNISGQPGGVVSVDTMYQ